MRELCGKGIAEARSEHDDKLARKITKISSKPQTAIVAKETRQGRVRSAFNLQRCPDYQLRPRRAVAIRVASCALARSHRETLLHRRV